MSAIKAEFDKVVTQMAVGTAVNQSELNTWQNTLMFSLLDNRIHWWQLGWDSLTALPLETVQDKLETVQDKLETVQDKLETVQDKLGTVQDTVQDKLGNAQEKLENTQ